MIYCKYIKRLLDFVLSLLAIILLCPILLLVALLIRIKLGRQVIFKQERPGLNEKVFTLYKFRTMTDEKDEEGNLLSDDIRLTKFGNMLRSTSLDELPELFNIFKGDLSIIGPRPLLVRYLPLYTDEQHRRHNVKPGLVGYAALSGRNNQTWESKFKADSYYVDNISFKLDLYIFIRAIKVVITREGISRDGYAVGQECFERSNNEKKGV